MDPLVDVSLAALLTLFAVYTAIGNLMVILAVKSDPRLGAPHYKLLASLAVTDLIVGAVTLPTRIFLKTYLPGHWTYGLWPCSLFWYLSVTVSASSKFHLLAIAIDRYWTLSSVTHAYAPSKRMVNQMILGAWTCGALSFAPIAYFSTIDGDFSRNIEQFQFCAFGLDPRGVISATVFAFWAPLLVIIVLHVLMYRVAKRSAMTSTKRKINQGQTSQGSSSGKEETEPVDMIALRKQRERKAALTCAIITLAFVICWAPVFTMLAVVSIRPDLKRALQGPLAMGDLLGLLNSGVNPVIYTVFTLEMREAFKRLIAKPLKCCRN